MKGRNRIIIAIMALIGVFALSFAGCGGGGSSSGGEAASGGTLNIYMWTEYLPEEVFAQFEEETGIDVNVTYYSSNEDLYAKLKSSGEGTYDVIQPSDYMVKTMIEEGMLEPLDTSLLENYGNYDEAYLDPNYDPGNAYSIPYMGGAAMFLVNTAKVREPITGYAQMFDPAYAGQWVVLDDQRAIIGAANKFLGNSLNETDPDKLAAAKDALVAAKGNFKVFDSDSPKTSMLNGETSIGLMWNGDIAIALEEGGGDFEVVFPEEGCYLFFDNWAIAKGAKNVDAAYAWFDYFLLPEVGAQITEAYPYITANAAARELLSEEYLSNPAKNIPSDVIANGEYVLDLDAEPLQVYDEIWTEFKQ